jgi:uncharacterized DUF497 family protein
LPDSSTIRRKARTIRFKHGIDFEEAQALWKAEKFIEGDANSSTEPRSFRIAKADETLWFAVYTMRAEKIRLITVRHTRDAERELYEQS